MRRFKTFVLESTQRYTSVRDIENAISSHIKNTEILNPVFKDLVTQAKRVFANDARVGRDLVLGNTRNNRDDNDISELYYAWPTDSFSGLKKFSKLLEKIKNKSQYKQTYIAGKKLLSIWQPIADDLNKLKGMTVKVAQKRAEQKQKDQIIQQKKYSDASILLKIFEVHHNEYIKRAEQQAQEFIKQRLDVLKKADWDLNKVAPVPNSRLSREEYMKAKHKRDLYTSITTAKNNSRRPGDPDTREPKQSMIARYIDNAKKEADESYRSFIQKMINKIGKPVIDAKLTGNIWTNATLTVTTNDGETQVWQTRMIINFSKYQRMFNQFPTRRKQ